MLDCSSSNSSEADHCDNIDSDIFKGFEYTAKSEMVPKQEVIKVEADESKEEVKVAAAKQKEEEKVHVDDSSHPSQWLPTLIEQDQKETRPENFSRAIKQFA